MTLFTRVGALGLAPLGLLGDLLAQQIQAPPPLERGSAVRVEATGVVGRLEGRFERYTADSLILNAPGGARSAVPLGTLRTVWVRSHATRTGAIVGAAVGLVAGALVGGVGCGLGHSDDGIVGNEGFDAGCAAAGAGIGLLVGAGAGAGIGALIPKWRLRFRTPI